MTLDKEQQLRLLVKELRAEDANMGNAILRLVAEKIETILDDVTSTNAEEVSDAAAGEK